MVLLVPVRRASLLVAALAFAACDLDPEPDAPPLPGLMAPLPRTPMSNAYVGSVHVPFSLMPTFSWAPSDGGAPISYYELQISTDPAFARSLHTIITGDTLVKPTFELPASRQVPVGALYYWRVRACDVDCSEFSSARTLNLGRSAHDVNGDGLADVLVGSPGHGSDSPGMVELYLGGLGAAFDGEPDGTLVAPVTKDFFGTRVASAGDFNGDGFADVIVGAPEARNAAGAAYVYFGGAGTLFDPTPDLVLHGNAPGDRLGSAVDGAGDLNSDGFADLVIGAPHVGGEVGAVYVYLGNRDGALTMRTLVVLYSGGSKSSFGTIAYSKIIGPMDELLADWLVASPGDVNGDGFADLVIGSLSSAPSASGLVSIYAGGSRLALNTPPYGTLHSR